MDSEARPRPTEQDLLAAVKDMRNKQQTYFKTRKGWDLTAAKAAEKLVDEVVELRQVDCWIPVSDKLPPEDQLVLIAYQSESGTRTGAALMRPCDEQGVIEWVRHDDDSDGMENVTHWMHLPEPPAGDQ